MATLSEHASLIYAAIKAAEDDGFGLEFDYDIGDGSPIELSLDLVHREWVDVPASKYLPARRVNKVVDWEPIKVEKY